MLGTAGVGVTVGEASGRGYAWPVPSYVHLCTSCGTALTVHERYFSRTLRCTSCGESFVAEPPEAADPGLTHAPPSESKPDRTGPVVLAATAVAVVVAIVVWLGLPKSSSPLGSLFKRQLFTGQIVQVRADGPWFAAIDRDVAAELVHAGSDRTSVNRFAADGRCLALGSGTSLRIIEVRKRDRVVVVRVLDGPWRDRQVWIPRAWVR